LNPMRAKGASIVELIIIAALLISASGMTFHFFGPEVKNRLFPYLMETVLGSKKSKQAPKAEAQAPDESSKKEGEANSGEGASKENLPEGAKKEAETATP